MDVRPMEYLARTNGGFTTPWRSTVEGWSGEDAYSALVAEHLTKRTVVVEAGCGHGAEALGLAPAVDHIIAFDAIEAFIEIARREASSRQINNVEFIASDCSPKRNNGRAVLPVPDHSADLVISRRGPSSWIADARRALRPGGVMIHLAFMQPPEPEWNRALPEQLQIVTEPETMPTAVHERLDAAGIELHSAWIFDVPERFTDPAELYQRLAWERRTAVPTLDDVRDTLAALFEERGSERISIRQRRFLWKAVIP